MIKDERKSRTSEEIFADMHRQLRSWNAEIPESPERLDPILRILLQLYAHQLSRIDRRIDLTWETATNALIRSLVPECKKWPVPAYTVMRCQPADPTVEVDAHTRFFHKEKREGGETYFFSALRKEKLLAAHTKHVLLRFGDTVVDLSPRPESDASPPPPSALPESLSGLGQVYLALDYEGTANDFAGSLVFLKGPSQAVKQLRWARWYPSSHMGPFYEDVSFFPGLAGGIEEIFSVNGQAPDWGGLRTTADLLRPLEDNLAVFPEAFAATWERGPLSEDIMQLLAKNGIEPGPLAESHYWIRMDLPPGGDRSKLLSPWALFLDCLVAVNKNELTLFKHTGGNRLVELELPEDIASLLEISHVVDSSSREYIPVHQMQSDQSQRYYSLEERDDRIVLWFDFSSPVELPPESITVTYTVTAGVRANAIEPGKINTLYDNHPGIAAVENVIPTAGAIPAKTDQQVVTEAMTRLRSRDRALGFSEISNWALTFDPRITNVSCENGTERGSRGVHRCIVVRATIKQNEFYSEDETALLKQRLNRFLKSRSPVNTHFSIEIIAG